MNDDLIQHNHGTTPMAPAWRPISIETAMPYLKAIGLVTTLLVMWAGFCVN
jgi:hypothetical protein